MDLFIKRKTRARTMKFIEERQKEALDNPDRIKCLVIAVDMDKTLTKTSIWHRTDPEPAPNQVMIDIINELYKSHFIVIHTARRHSLYDVTIDWLRKHKVNYHAICMNKMSADAYIDDKAFNPFSKGG